MCTRLPEMRCIAWDSVTKWLTFGRGDFCPRTAGQRVTKRCAYLLLLNFPAHRRLGVIGVVIFQGKRPWTEAPHTHLPLTIVLPQVFVLCAMQKTCVPADTHRTSAPTQAISSSGRATFCCDNTAIAVKNNFTALFIIIFGTLSFPSHNSWQVTRTVWINSSVN